MKKSVKVIDVVENNVISSYGLSSMVSHEHRGITVEFSNGEKFSGYYMFNAKKYGNFVEVKSGDIYRGLNGRFASKHVEYIDRVEARFKELMDEKLKNLIGIWFKDIATAKRVIRNAYHNEKVFLEITSVDYDTDIEVEIDFHDVEVSFKDLQKPDEIGIIVSEEAEVMHDDYLEVRVYDVEFLIGG